MQAGSRRGFTVIEVLIVVVCIGIIAAITMRPLLDTRFESRFGFKPTPKTPLKQELVWDHVNALGRACEEASRREREFKERPIQLTLKQKEELEELEMRASGLYKQTDALCTLHAAAVLHANRRGYSPTKPPVTGDSTQGDTK
jgi:prepilin-type N-terminal cleavage/methylation domain-containing protein